jgi:hypothetical protein
MTRTRKRIIVLGATVLVALAGAWVGVAFFRPREAEPSINLPRSAEEGFQAAASAEFAKLPDYRQEAYRREVQRLVAALPEDQRQAMFARHRGSREFLKGVREVRYDPVRTAATEYFKAVPENRTAVLDKWIDRMEKFRALGGLGRSAGQGGNGLSGATPEMRDFVKQRIESQIQEGDPQETAQTMEFLKQFRQRRIDRGLPIP